MKNRPPRILQLLSIRQILQTLQPEHDKELLGRHEGIGRAALRGSWPGPDQTLRVQPPDQVAADVFAENVPQPVAGDWLVIGDGGEDSDVEFAQVQQLIPDIRRGANRGA